MYILEIRVAQNRFSVSKDRILKKNVFLKIQKPETDIFIKYVFFWKLIRKINRFQKLKTDFHRI